tara:strand:+ start:886 stop:1158 length:273 start_codon:yes stop_codon:yes gene_type:complete
MAKKMKKLSSEELSLLQSLNQEFSQTKLALGDTVLQQNKLMEKVEVIKVKFGEQENILMEKYGKDVTINLENGEITDKPESPELTKVETE